MSSSRINFLATSGDVPFNDIDVSGGERGVEVILLLFFLSFGFVEVGFPESTAEGDVKDYMVRYGVITPRGPTAFNTRIHATCHLPHVVSYLWIFPLPFSLPFCLPSEFVRKRKRNNEYNKVIGCVSNPDIVCS